MAVPAPSFMSSRRRAAVALRADLGIALAVAAVEFGSAYAAAGRGEVHHPWDPIAVLLLAAGPVALTIRRSHPPASLAVALLSALAYSAAGHGRGPQFPALVLAFLTTVAGGYRVAALASLAAGYGGFLWAGPAIAGQRLPGAAGIVGTAAWFLVLYAAGEAFRVRRARTADRARVLDADARRRSSEERLAIARELHDVLAHNIAVINVQAGTALHRAARSEERAYEALATIHKVSQDTIAELRSLLGTIRNAGDAPPRNSTPTLGRLDELIASAAAAGVSAHVETHGHPYELAASVDLAAYRVIQEALTNVARHATTPNARVRIDYEPAELGVQVDDDGRPTGPVTLGTGLTGMAERVAAAGGHLHAGPRPAGGFRVCARFPAVRHP